MISVTPVPAVVVSSDPTPPVAQEVEVNREVAIEGVEVDEGGRQALALQSLAELIADETHRTVLPS